LHGDRYPSDIRGNTYAGRSMDILNYTRWIASDVAIAVHKWRSMEPAAIHSATTPCDLVRLMKPHNKMQNATQ
jgi:hypothetical protein